MSNTRTTRKRPLAAVKPEPNGAAPDLKDKGEAAPVLADPEFPPPDNSEMQMGQQPQMQIPQLSPEAAMTQVIVEQKQLAYQQLTEYQIRSGQVIKELMSIAEAALTAPPKDKGKLKQRLEQMKRQLTQVNI